MGGSYLMSNCRAALDSWGQAYAGHGSFAYVGCTVPSSLLARGRNTKTSHDTSLGT
jgi:hypothetical protein